MVKVLINAYACAPNMGSEPGMAWNWIINLARFCKLYVITEGEWQNEIESYIKENKLEDRVKFYYNPVSDEIRKMCWNQGDWRFYKHYRIWQLKTYGIAQEIINANNIDIVHQLNMIGFREPGYFWKLNKPFVWGPIDAKEKFPIEYLKGATLKQKLVTRLKNQLTTIQFKTSKRVKLAAEKADVILGASSESVNSIKKFYNKTAVLLNETGCYVNEKEVEPKAAPVEFNLLWVGKFDFRKQLELALKTLRELSNQYVKLHVVGDDQNEEAAKYKLLCREIGVDNQCEWYGKVSHAKVQELMTQSDLFFFTSVAEGTPHVVLEAIGNNLPILCFDVCGHGDSVNNKVGVKIPLSTPDQSVKEFAREIISMIEDKDKLISLSQNCKQRQKELSWEHKANFVHKLYIDILSNEK